MFLARNNGPIDFCIRRESQLSDSELPCREALTAGHQIKLRCDSYRVERSRCVCTLRPVATCPGNRLLQSP